MGWNVSGGSGWTCGQAPSVLFVCVVSIAWLFALAAAIAHAKQFAYVTTEDQNALAIVDTDSDTMVSTIPLSTGPDDLVVALDGGTAYALNAQTRSVAVIDLSSRMIVGNIPVGEYATRIAMSPDGRFLFVAGLPSVQIDLTDGSATSVLNVPLVFDVRISPDGRHAYFATSQYGDGEIGLVSIDTKTAAVTTGAKGFSTWALAVDPKGRFIYLLGNNAGVAEGRLRVLDTSSLAVLLDVRLDSDPLDGDIAVTPDGATLYISSGFRFQAPLIYVVDPLTGGVREQIGSLSGPERLAFSPDAEHLYVSEPVAHAVSVIDTASQAVTATIPVGVGLLGIAASPADGSVYVAAEDGLHVIDPVTQEVVTAVPGLTDPTGVAATPDGRMLYIAGQASGSVGIVDTNAGRLIRGIQTGGHPLGVVVAPAAGRAYVSSFDVPGSVFVIDTATDTLVDTVGVPGQAGGVTITPDGRRVLVANYYFSTISVIDIASDTVVQELGGVLGATGVAVSSDGQFGVVGGEDEIQFLGSLDGPLSLTGTLRFPIDFGSVLPCALAIRRDGTRAYATDVREGNVYEIDPIHQTLLATTFTGIPYASDSCGIALPPDDRRVYIANNANSALTVLDSDDLHIIKHIRVPPHPYGIAITCPGGCPTPLPTATPGPCYGDCHGEGRITIDDLIIGIRIALSEATLAACPSFDVDGDGRVSINEVVGAVRAALDGC